MTRDTRRTARNQEGSTLWSRELRDGPVPEAGRKIARKLRRIMFMCPRLDTWPDGDEPLWAILGDRRIGGDQRDERLAGPDAWPLRIAEGLRRFEGRKPG